jgi:hypothetical protein
MPVLEEAGAVEPIEKSDTVIPEKTIVIPASVERPSLVANFPKPMMKGQVARISVFLDEVEIITLKYLCTEDVEPGFNLLPYVHFQPLLNRIPLIKE